MATTGLEVFDRTLHTTNLWLDEINAEIGPDRHLAWHVLGAVLRSLRDEMQVEQSAHFAAQLPLLVRGAYFDQYRPATQPASARSHDEFISRIQHDLDGSRPVNVQLAAAAVMRTLNRHVTEGQVKKVRDALPKGVRAMWPEPEHKEPEHKPERAEPGMHNPDRSAKPGQDEKGAPPPRSAGQPASGGQHPTPQHTAPPDPQTAPPRSAAQHAEPPHSASPQHSTQQHPPASHRIAQYEREDIREEIDHYEEDASSIGRSSSASSGKSMPMGAAGGPAKADAAQAASGRKTKTRTKRPDEGQ